MQNVACKLSFLEKRKDITVCGTSTPKKSTLFISGTMQIAMNNGDSVVEPRMLLDCFKDSRILQATNTNVEVYKTFTMGYLANLNMCKVRVINLEDVAHSIR